MCVFSAGGVCVCSVPLSPRGQYESSGPERKHSGSLMVLVQPAWKRSTSAAAAHFEGRRRTKGSKISIASGKTEPFTPAECLIIN